LTKPNRKLYLRALNNPRGLRFAELRTLVECYGYRLGRISGSHHIYYHPAVPSPLNLQPDGNGMAKAYQVRDFLDDVTAHLTEEQGDNS
jgi:hypothetical protein